MNTMTVPEAEQAPTTPIVLVGSTTHDEKIVMRRLFVRCSISTPERGEFLKLTPMEEIPLLRKLYSQYGGSIRVVGGLEHPSYGRYSVQDLNASTLRNVIIYFKCTYNNVLIQKRLHNFFDDVYGAGEHCTLLEKMQSLIEEWDGSLEAPTLEAMIQRHFPHVATRSQDDILSIPGLDGLSSAPKVGARAQSAAPTTSEKARIVEPPMGDAKPESRAEQSRLDATILTGDPGPDPDLVAFLMDPEKTSGNPLLENQAWAVASLVVKKPVFDWDGDDYQAIPGLSKRNHVRISRLVDAFLQTKLPEGGQDESDDAQDDMFT